MPISRSLLGIFTPSLVMAALMAVAPAAAQEEAEGILVPPVRPGITECPTLEDLGYQAKSITDIQLDISIDRERLPIDCSQGLFTPAHGSEMVSYVETQFSWAASELYAQPAYWDDPVLERYGQAAHPLVQPFLSGAHFFAMFPAIPYRIGMDRTHDRIYTLGYYRPGSPTPRIGRRLPWEADAAGFEAATWLALIFLLP